MIIYVETILEHIFKIFLLSLSFNIFEYFGISKKARDKTLLLLSPLITLFQFQFFFSWSNFHFCCGGRRFWKLVKKNQIFFRMKIIFLPLKRMKCTPLFQSPSFSPNCTNCFAVLPILNHYNSPHWCFNKRFKISLKCYFKSLEIKAWPWKWGIKCQIYWEELAHQW